MIPSPERLGRIPTAGDDSFLLVTDDVYRITEQVNRTTCRHERLKHRRPGDPAAH